MALWERRSLVVARQCPHQRFRSCRLRSGRMGRPLRRRRRTRLWSRYLL